MPPYHSQVQPLRSLGTNPTADGGERLQQLSPSFAAVHIYRGLYALASEPANLIEQQNDFVFTIWVHHPHSWSPICILRFPDLYKKGAERRAKMLWGGEQAAVSCRQTFLAKDVGIGRRT